MQCVFPIATWQISQQKFACELVMLSHRLLALVFSSIPTKEEIVDTTGEERNIDDGGWWHRPWLSCTNRDSERPCHPPNDITALEFAFCTYA